jgi:hypothetical protein
MKMAPQYDASGAKAWRQRRQNVTPSKARQASGTKKRRQNMAPVALKRDASGVKTWRHYMGTFYHLMWLQKVKSDGRNWRQ